MATTGEICSRDVVVVPRDETVQSAAKLMRHNHVGTVVVVDEVKGRRTPVGIVTDRDVVIEVTAVDLNPNVITVGDIMAPDLVIVRDDEGAFEAMDIMRRKGVRRLPVVDREGGLAGIISVDDLLEVLSEEMSAMTRIVGRERAHEQSRRK
jgi:CBS domain-containing protein